MNWIDINKHKPLAYGVVMVKDLKGRTIRARWNPRGKKWDIDNLDSSRRHFGKPTHWTSIYDFKNGNN